MMAGTDRVGQSIPAYVTGAPLLALPCCSVSSKQCVVTCLDSHDGYTIPCGQHTDRLITRSLIDQMHDAELQPWTPVRGRDTGGHPYTLSSHATTLESHKSVTTQCMR